MYEQEQDFKREEERLAVAADSAENPADAGVVEQEEAIPATVPNKPDDHPHGECCDDCKRTCKRNFWTSVLNAVVKISTIVLAAFGIQSFGTEE